MASRRTLLAALAGILIVVITVAPTNADDSAAEFIEVLGARTVAVLQGKASDREAALRAILVDAFHMTTISRFVLGQYWQTATDQQRDAISSAFVDSLVRIYARLFGAYDGETFEVLKVIEDDGGDTIVRTRLLRPSGGAPIGIDYRVRNFDDRYKVVDVNVEGISMLHTHRVEFEFNRKGMEGIPSDPRMGDWLPLNRPLASEQ